MDTVRCEECGGTGTDPGSLRACPRCCGAGLLVAPAEVERVARKVMGRAETSERLPAGWFEERKYRVGE
jgi:DnaJ-class molecular chaperone